MFKIEPNKNIPRTVIDSIVDDIFSVINDADFEYSYQVSTAGYHEPHVSVEYWEFSNPEWIRTLIKRLLIMESARLREVALMDEWTAEQFKS